jgi:hypothetical protein
MNEKMHVIVSTLIDIKTTLPTNNDDSKYARRVVSVRSKLEERRRHSRKERAEKKKLMTQEQLQQPPSAALPLASGFDIIHLPSEREASQHMDSSLFSPLSSRSQAARKREKEKRQKEVL